MASDCLNDYIEDNLTTEKVLLLTGKSSVSNTTTSSSDIENAHRNNLSTSTADGHLSSDRDSMKTASIISKDDTISCSNTDNMSNSSTVTDVLMPGIKKKITDCYPLWENEKFLCWLDVILGIFVFNTSLKVSSEEESANLMSNFYEHYRAQMAIFRRMGDYSTVKDSLDDFRSTVRRFLQPKMLSNFSEEDSPLLAIELLVKTNKKTYEKMEVAYQSEFQCSKCDFNRKDG